MSVVMTEAGLLVKRLGSSLKPELEKVLRDLVGHYHPLVLKRHLAQHVKAHPLRSRIGASVGLLWVYFLASDRRRRTRTREGLRALFWAVRSKALRTIVLTSLALTFTSVKMGWISKKRRHLFPLTMSAIWMLYYYFRVIEHGVVRCQRTYWNVHIVEKARLTKEKFRPVFWAYNRHAQTVICFLFTHLEWIWSKRISVERAVVPAWDGNTLHVDWLRIGKRANYEGNGLFGEDSPILLLVHGLGDNTDHPYIKRFARMCSRHGWRSVAFSYWRMDFGEVRDLKDVIDYLHRTNPRAPIIAQAWSAGGHILLKYLGVVGKDTPLVAAITNSGCFDFVQACNDIYENENESYKFFLGVQIRECARRHLEHDIHIGDKKPFRKMRGQISVHQPLEYYDRFISLLPSFSGRDDEAMQAPYRLLANTASHYKESAISLVDNVAVSTLVIHARDDPVVSYQHIDWERVRRNKNIITITTRRGGHCSWYTDVLPFGSMWSELISGNFISAVLETHSHTHFILDVLKRAGQDPADSVPSPKRMARICSASDLKGWDLAQLSRLGGGGTARRSSGSSSPAFGPSTGHFLDVRKGSLQLGLSQAPRKP